MKYMVLILCCIAFITSQLVSESKETILMVVPDKNFYDPEYIIPLKALESTGFAIEIANLSGKVSKGIVGLELQAKLAVNDANESNYKALLLVGGYGAASFYDNQDLINLIRQFDRAKKVIGAQCYSPVVLAQAGLLQNMPATCWPDQAKYLTTAGAQFTNASVEITGRIVTGMAGSENNISKFAEAFLATIQKESGD